MSSVARVTVTDTAVQIINAGAASSVTIHTAASGKIWLGGDANVTPRTGFEVPGGTILTLPITTDTIFAVASTGKTVGVSIIVVI